MQTLKSREEQFEDVTDLEKLAAIFKFYQRLVHSHQIDPIDVKARSGWWGDEDTAYRANKVKADSLLKANLVEMSAQWSVRQAFLADGDIESETGKNSRL